MNLKKIHLEQPTTLDFDFILMWDKTYTTAEKIVRRRFSPLVKNIEHFLMNIRENIIGQTE